VSEVILIRGSRHVVWECRTCGCVSTVPEIVNDQLRAEGGYRSCPSGHQWGWTKETCEREKLRQERDRLKQDQARLEEEAKQAWATASALRERADKAEKATKRLKKRSSAGTCPCCARTFSNMAEHMKHQHPEFVADGGAKVVPIKRKTA
jgi:hypothetical protein